ncbi:hypothetical protein ACQEV4_39085 [Streptomyces shenzhenensis]|uniref:hypothetical protein n=1 Tax=Streptomyces shenzhenensis TaxID=943815 RepID=UPI003D8D0648
MSAGGQGDADDRLPLRWLVILAISSAVGIVVGAKTGLESGMTAGVAVAGLLHLITR